MLAMLATQKGRLGALFCFLLVATAQAQTSWDDIRRSALAAAPDSAEKMGAAITRKMREDWPGFLALLARHPREDAFFDVVLRSINPTLSTADLHELDALAHKSCPGVHRTRCDAIAREAAAALKDAN
jgi:hypothetical protein